MTYGLTPEGWVAKTFDDVFAGIVARQRATIDPGIDTSPDSVIGQLNGIISNEMTQLWEMGHGLYDALDPDRAVGAQQDALYSLTNTLRRPPTKSRVAATVNLASGTNIAPGDAIASVNGNPEARFVNLEPMVNAGPTVANFGVLFEAEQTGPIFANAGTLTVMETFVAGWNSITNAGNAQLGAGIETDPEFRLRRLRELTAIGGGTVSGIRADLSQVDGVLAVIVLENDTDTVVAGMPPHSVEAIVQGGDPQAIAASIFKNKVGGIRTHGNEPAVEVIDEQGHAHDIYFSRPIEVPIYVTIEVAVDEGYDQDVLRQRLLDSSISKLDPGYLDVGTSVYAGRIVYTALQVAGVRNAVAGVALALPDGGLGDPSVSISAREVAVLSPSRIYITEGL